MAAIEIADDSDNDVEMGPVMMDLTHLDDDFRALIVARGSAPPRPSIIPPGLQPLLTGSALFALAALGGRFCELLCGFQSWASTV